MSVNASYSFGGYTCWNCGLYVTSGQQHCCSSLPMPTQVTSSWDRTGEMIALLERIAAALDRLAEKP